MSATFSKKNLQSAYRAVLHCTGIGAALAIEWDLLMAEKVKPRVGIEQHSRFTRSVLMCAIRVCTDPPFSWNVTISSNPIDLEDETTFKDIYDWFTNLLTRRKD